MTKWMPDLAAHSGPAYKAIADAIAQGIADGSLPVGTRLPTHRDLAWSLGVTVTTVTRGYQEAQRRGLTDAAVGRGTFVREAGSLGPPPLMDTRYAVPMPMPASQPGTPPGPGDIVDLGLNFPVLTRQSAVFAETLASVVRDGNHGAFLTYGPDTGLPKHRAAAAAWLGRLGLAASPESIIMTTGAQQAIMATLMAVCRTGDHVLMEEWSFPGAKSAIATLGLKPHGVAMDAQGLCPDALDAACRAHAPTALYTIPTLQNPTARVMSPQRRAAIVEVARRHNLVIIEDDIYGHLPPQPLVPLAMLAPERTVYVTSCSKSMAPGLRVGFAAAPPDLVGRIASGVRVMSWMVPPLMAEIARRWIESGAADAMVADLRATALRRRALAEDILAPDRSGLDMCAGVRESLHLWVGLPPGWNATTFIDRARRGGVMLQPLEVFGVGRTNHDHIRLCTGTENDEARYVEGLRRLARVLEEGQTAAVAVM